MTNDTRIKEAIEVLENIKPLLGLIPDLGIQGVMQGVKALSLAIKVLSGLEKEVIAKILLDTCEKELNESIGFMLTTNDANIFATAILNSLVAEN